MSPRLCGFVALCENQVLVFQGFAFLSIQNLRKKTRFEQVAVRKRPPAATKECTHKGTKITKRSDAEMSP